jgi:hypothetical protein
VPSHHHDGPHLVVAVSDLDLRSDVEGQGPMPAKFKAGEIKWLPGGYTHTIDECRAETGEICDGGILERRGLPRLPLCRARPSRVKPIVYSLLTSGFPGETRPTRCSLAVRRSLSVEAEAAARRLRNFATFSARVRRRRISGRRLGADITFSLWYSVPVFSDWSSMPIFDADQRNHESEFRSTPRARVEGLIIRFIGIAGKDADQQVVS